MAEDRKRSREEYERGLPDYHDPTGRFGGAAPMYSALSLRIVLAALTVVLAIAGAVVAGMLGATWAVVVLVVLAVASAIDLGWVIHRKRRGEPG
ncbi:hypothetical protein SAMN05421810_101562 [Amycolatopsis arida]|uniref:Uncharacterized protein n=1 Tax=Amycolatopsis arida TaxID=587909 RepID=A0A1I5LJC4_9PSEU|nr:hypothetical protein [Amycolatopsis arida]TDX93739.1 hypothetical protein CLV69_104195 [Amycolatopsis arida]SFO97267.1 hypothetical protein SAMN05421810_101562 [Amycolatopsis arida]